MKRQMKRLKRRLLEQIKSSGGRPCNSLNDKEFTKAADHFEQTERSLRRVQAAMAAWGGALDAFATCNQVLAEELARHLILVSRPTDPLKHGLDSNSSTCCKVLQGLMTMSDKIAQPVYDAFIDGALRPKLQYSINETRPLQDLIEERNKALSTVVGMRRKTQHHGVADENEPHNEQDKCQLNGDKKSKKNKLSRLHSAEQSLQNMTADCVEKLEAFREEQISRVPEEIGVIVGCQYELSTRIAQQVEKYLPVFPSSAATTVDIAVGSTRTTERLAHRRRKKLENIAVMTEEHDRRLKRHYSNASFGSGKSLPGVVSGRFVGYSPKGSPVDHQHNNTSTSPLGEPKKRFSSKKFSHTMRRCKSGGMVLRSSESVHPTAHDFRSQSPIATFNRQQGLEFLESENEETDDDDDMAHSSWSSSLVHLNEDETEHFDESSTCEKSELYVPEITCPPRLPFKTNDKFTSIGFTTLHEQFRVDSGF